MLTLFLIFFINSFSTASAACDLNLYKGEDWTFIRAVAVSQKTPDEKFDAVEKACRELGDTDFAHRRRGFGNAIFGVAWNTFRAMGFGPGAFSNLGGTEVQEIFKAELEKIRPIENPIIRIQKVSDLVGRFQGGYDYSRFGGGKPYILPGRLLDKAAKDGDAGQCRDFTLLLYWSLLQVARHPVDDKGLGSLSDKSFSMDPIFGNASQSGHEWLRINLLVRDPKTRGIKFEHFDLDPTFYSGFVPLLPRQMNLSEVERASQEEKCKALVTCLAEESIKDAIPKLESIFVERQTTCP